MERFSWETFRWLSVVCEVKQRQARGPSSSPPWVRTWVPHHCQSCRLLSAGRPLRPLWLTETEPWIGNTQYGQRDTARGRPLPGPTAVTWSTWSPRANGAGHLL